MVGEIFAVGLQAGGFRKLGSGIGCYPDRLNVLGLCCVKRLRTFYSDLFCFF